MATHEFTHHSPHPPEQVWQWFERPGALVRLSPPWLPLRPVTEAENVRSGQAELAVAPFGVRLPLPKWQASHESADFVDERRFVDRTTSQPYAAVTGWRHEHDFTPSGSGTLLTDRVTSRVPRRALAPVFAYRAEQLDGDLAAHARYPKRLTVAITGASGLVGTQLAAYLSTGGHRVIELVRSPRRSAHETRHWDVERPDASMLDGVDVLVHLAGAPILGRFSDKHKSAVRDSRVGPTRALAELVARLDHRVAFVCASAVGFYGTDRGDEMLTETSGRGAGFLADVVEQWEAACAPARNAGVRVTGVRTAGMVLSSAGGALAALRPVFSLGAGGRIGSGRQWMSWISIDDLLDVYLRAICDDELDGTVNAVAPQPVRNVDFTRALGRAVRRPTLVPTPAFAPRLVLADEGYDEMLLASHRELPARLVELGHEFRHPSLDVCLAHELGR